MIVDANLSVAGSITGNTVTGQNVFGNGTTVVSSNSIDLSSTREIGEGEDIYARVEVTTAFSGGTSGQFQAIVADDAALTTNVTIVGAGEVVPVASLVAGYRAAIRVNPRVGLLGRRYLGIQCVNAGNNTAGAIYGDFGQGIQDGQKFYPSGFSVL